MLDGTYCIAGLFEVSSIDLSTAHPNTRPKPTLRFQSHLLENTEGGYEPTLLG